MYYETLLSQEKTFDLLLEHEKKGINFHRLQREWWDVNCKSFDIWDGKFTQPVTRYYKVSVCTHCMNKLEEAKWSVPKNIEDNSDYPNFELVLLDYNSTDGLEDWVKSEMMEFIERGILVYYKMEGPTYFWAQHARNVTMKAASGKIVNLVDLNKCTNKGFASYINRVANQFPYKPIIFTIGGKNPRLRGRLGFFKHDFIRLGGYNEQFLGYSWDDRELMYRALKSKFTLACYGGKFHDFFKRKVPLERNLHPKLEDLGLTYKLSCLMGFMNLFEGRLVANEGKHWGKAKLVKNFKYEIQL